MEKYENVELETDDVEGLKQLEQKLGVPIPHIDKISWDDFRIDEQTHHVVKFKQHQFGFVSKGNKVIALGLSFNSTNEKKMVSPLFMPDLTKFSALEQLDINCWDKVFEKFLAETNRRQQAFKDSQRKFYKSIEERREAQSKSQRDMHQPIHGVSFTDVSRQLQKMLNLKFLDVSNCSLKFVGFLENTPNLNFLDLSENEISKFSQNLETMNSLETLYVDNNPLTEFPAELVKAKNLKILNLSDTKIKEIPEFISEIESLEELKFPLQIIGFPQSLIHLKNLKTLVINHFPEHLKELKSLETLIISSSKEKHLSEGLTELTALKELVINNCRSLIGLPENLDKLDKLESLIVTGNLSLEQVPSSLFTLKNLRNLNFYNNKLKTFPDRLGDLPMLEILTLSNNQLERLPYSVFKLSNLIDFSIENNPLVLNDKLISAKTLPEIKTYSKKKMAVNVFISHAVADYEPCHLAELGEYLEKQIEVNVAFLCERDLSGNIDGFMDKNVPKSHLVLFIATNQSVNSVDCQYELKLSREYDVQVIPIKAKALDWGDLAKIGLNRELGLECDFQDADAVQEFNESLYKYIKQLKRQIDLQDKKQRKINRLTMGLKVVERKVDELIQKVESVETRLSKMEPN